MAKVKAKDIADSIEKKEKKELEPLMYPGDTSILVSTGSDLLDLAITGGVTEEGGIPGGIVCEIFGPSQTGKTAVLAEICASAQVRGGETQFIDPEARYNIEYGRKYGFELDMKTYYQPDTVTETFDLVRNWKPTAKGPKVTAMDSLAALSSELEMSDGGDKMGMRRAKEFSQEFRKNCRMFAQRGWIIVCSNQVRQKKGGGTKSASGGEALGFYASTRLEFKVPHPFKIEKTAKLYGIDHTEIIGVKTDVTVIKNSTDKPYRTASLYIMFNHGIDNIRANLQFIKDNTAPKTKDKDNKKATLYTAVDKEYGVLNAAIAHIEKEGLVSELKQNTIKLWKEINNLFIDTRLPKVRV